MLACAFAMAALGTFGVLTRREAGPGNAIYMMAIAVFVWVAWLGLKAFMLAADDDDWAAHEADRQG